MAPNEINNLLRSRPFEPFRMFISDGAHYDIRHPEMAIVSMTGVVIGKGITKDGVASELVYCDTRHVTRIEPLNGHAKKASRPKRRGR